MRNKTRPIIRNAQRGMTLVEIMIVVAIIGLVMGAVVVGAVPALEKARCKTAWSDTQNIKHAITMYQTDNNGDCPSMEQLKSSKLLKKTTDPWGQDYRFSNVTDEDINCPGVYSMGRNKKDGDDDDVKGWTKSAEEACKSK